MKKWMIYFFSLTLFISILFPLSVFAESKDSAKITVNGSSADISLRLPLGKYENITSLRLQLNIATKSGNIALNKENILLNNYGSEVQEVLVDDSKVNGVYLVDIMISGTSDIFAGMNENIENFINIANITVQSGDGEKAEAEVTIVDNKYEIVNSAGTLKVISVSGVSGLLEIPGQEQLPQPTPTPEPETPTPTPEPGKPQPTPTPEPGKPQPTPTPEPETPTPTPDPEEPAPTPTPTPSQDEFDASKGTKIKGQGKSGTSRVNLKWEKAAGADGYQIYIYDYATKKSGRLKTVLDSNVNTYTTKQLSYASNYLFKIRAFSVNEDGTRNYGKFGAIIKVKTAPANVSISSLKAVKKGQAVLTWKRTAGADGYQIFRSASKNGKYVGVRNISGNSTSKYTLKGMKSGSTYYYKVRAYVIDSNGNRIYSSLSSAKAVKGL